MTILRIGYFADGPWSHQALAKLLADPTIEVTFVCARFDTPDPTLRAMASRHGLAFLVNQDVNSRNFLEEVQAHECGLLVSMSFNQIFRREFIQLAPRGTINCHAGKLPFYRGRNVLNWALINDEREFGITVHYVNENIDTGDIILQRCYPITDDDDYSTLLECAYKGCAETLYEAVKLIQNDRASPLAQSDVHPVGFYCSARRPGDEKLDWNQTSREVFNFVRAICRPGPEARTFFAGQEIRINKVQLLTDAPVYKGIPGAVVSLGSDSFVVKTADSTIRVAEWSGYPKPRIGDRLA